MIQKKVTLLKAALIFLAGALYFFLLLFTLLPFLKSNFSVNPALYWFGTGYFLFVPIFVSALMMAKAEGNQGTKQILSALHIRPFTKKEWKYSLGGLLLGFVLSGAVFGVSLLLNKYFAIRMIH